MIKTALVEGSFSDIFELEASPVEGQSLEQNDIRKDTKERRKKVKKKQKPKDVVHFLSLCHRLRCSDSQTSKDGPIPGPNRKKIDR